jgi:hypothetical protein
MHYLPNIHPRDYTEDSLGAALWLEKRHWKEMEIAVANGIIRAFEGDE